MIKKILIKTESVMKIDGPGRDKLGNFLQIISLARSTTSNTFRSRLMSSEAISSMMLSVHTITQPLRSSNASLDNFS